VGGRRRRRRTSSRSATSVLLFLAPSLWSCTMTSSHFLLSPLDRQENLPPLGLKIFLSPPLLVSRTITSQQLSEKARKQQRALSPLLRKMTFLFPPTKPSNGADPAWRSLAPPGVRRDPRKKWATSRPPEAPFARSGRGNKKGSESFGESCEKDLAICWGTCERAHPLRASPLERASSRPICRGVIPPPAKAPATTRRGRGRSRGRGRGGK